MHYARTAISRISSQKTQSKRDIVQHHPEFATSERTLLNGIAESIREAKPPERDFGMGESGGAQVQGSP